MVRAPGLSAARPTNLHDLPAVTHSPPPSAEPPRVSGTPFFRTPLRKLLALVVAIAAALGGVVAWQWWQEGPLRDAEAALARGQASRALALAEYYLDLHPGSERAEADRARALSDLGRADEAIEIYKRIGAATIDELRAWARAHMVRSEWSRAAPLLQQCLRLRPTDADALYELTTCRTRLGLLTEALESADRFTALPGQGARGNILLGAIQADQSNPDEAILAYQRAEALAPDGLGLQLPPEEFFEQFGTLLLNQGRDAEAIPLFERSLAARPTPATTSSARPWPAPAILKERGATGMPRSSSIQPASRRAKSWPIWRSWPAMPRRPGNGSPRSKGSRSSASNRPISSSGWRHSRKTTPPSRPGRKRQTSCGTGSN